MSDSSVPPPPPSAAPAVEEAPARNRDKVITLELDSAGERGGWRKKLSGKGEEGGRRIRLAGSEIVFEHPDALRAPLVIAAGLVAVASVDSSRADAPGRFPILRRMSRTAVVPQSDGVEGWLWTEASRSALPILGEGAPNLALVFIKPLEEDIVEGAFREDFLAVLAQNSPLGVPTFFGLLARVTDSMAAESAFTQLGSSGPVTDREVAPAQRRHLPTDRAANPSIAGLLDRREETSVPPPGMGRRSEDP